jgi:hypothetical protein
MKSIYCNSIMVSHSSEFFLLTFSFETPDGHRDSVYITISPSGAKTLIEMVAREIDLYSAEHGKIEDTWEVEKTPKSKLLASTPHLNVR